MKQRIPDLYGLVLVGGKSTRMGSDKRLLKYHNIPQQTYTHNLLDEVCTRTFLSIRKEQKEAFKSDVEKIVDQNEYHGPYNGILSAHRAFPDVAWLVLACDLPLIDQQTMSQLASKRNPDKMATSMATNKTGLPEPLVTIWEPKGLAAAITYLKTSKNSGPQEFLLNSDVELVRPKDDEVLFNANSLEDYHLAKSKLQLANGE